MSQRQPKYDPDYEAAVLHQAAVATSNMRRMALRNLTRHNQSANHGNGWSGAIVADMSDPEFEGLISNLLAGMKQESIGPELGRLHENIRDITVKRAESIEQPQACVLIQRVMRTTVQHAESLGSGSPLQHHMDQALFACGRHLFVDGPYKHSTRVHFVQPAVNYFAQRFVMHRFKERRYSKTVSGNAVEGLSKILANYESRYSLADSEGQEGLHPLVARNFKEIHQPSSAFLEEIEAKGQSLAIETRLRCS